MIDLINTFDEDIKNFVKFTIDVLTNRRILEVSSMSKEYDKIYDDLIQHISSKKEYRIIISNNKDQEEVFSVKPLDSLIYYNLLVKPKGKKKYTEKGFTDVWRLMLYHINNGKYTKVIASSMTKEVMCKYEKQFRSLLVERKKKYNK